MILGMSTATYTLLHVLISLVGIASGLVVMFGLLTGKRFDAWTASFLATTALTSIGGPAPTTRLNYHGGNAASVCMRPNIVSR
jgi:hypothetical protein